MIDYDMGYTWNALYLQMLMLKACSPVGHLLGIDWIMMSYPLKWIPPLFTYKFSGLLGEGAQLHEPSRWRLAILKGIFCSQTFPFSDSSQLSG